MNTENACCVMVSMVTSIRKVKTIWGTYTIPHSEPLGYEVVYQGSKKFKSLENNNKYSFGTKGLKVGETFIDTTYPIISCIEYVQRLEEILNESIPIGKHCSKRKILTLCSNRNEVMNYEKSIRT